MTLASAHPREGLRELRNNLYQYEADVCSGRSSIDPYFDNLIWQTVSIAIAEIDRQLANESGAPAWYARITIAGLVGLNLCQKLLDRREARKPATLTPASERSAIYALFSAVDALKAGKNGLAVKFNVPDITESLAKRIWFIYFNVTVEDVTALATEILTVLAIPKEEILAEIAEIQAKLAARGVK
jgi:hypothetical protein